uniref:Uncharacterized protein n=1 Tax=Arundo donax TaxID=35708 RepID=A0A0A8ZFD7_ARUDO
MPMASSAGAPPPPLPGS